MGFTGFEVLEDLPELYALAQKVQSGVKALSAAPSAEEYADLVASCLPALGKLIDHVRAQVAD